MSKLSVSPYSSVRFSDTYNNPDRVKTKKPGKNPSGASGKESVTPSHDNDTAIDGFILTHLKVGNINLRLNPGEPISLKAIDKLIQDLAMAREII